MHQGAGMEAKNNVRNMVKLFVERSVSLSGCWCSLHENINHIKDVEEQSENLTSYCNIPQKYAL